MQFQFVDNANIDAGTRKQIRSQVMQGKNTGKKRERVSYERKKLAVLASKSVATKDLQVSQTANGSSNDNSRTIYMENGSSESSVKSEDQLVEWAVTKAATYRYWDDYSMYKYPRELEVDMRRALHF